MPNSNDDASLHQHSLFSGGKQNETDSQLEEAFAEGLLSMFPFLRTPSETKSSGGRSDGTIRKVPQNSQGRDSEATKATAEITPSPLAFNRQESTGRVSAAMDEQRRKPGPEELTRRASTGSVPPRAPSPSPPETDGLRNTISTLLKGSVRSRAGHRKKRKELLVRSFFSKVFVKKKTDGNLAPKAMCDYFHVVVGRSSDCLLLHTGNCPKTPLVSKRNALEQSKAKTTPKLALDSPHGAGRETNEVEKATDRSREVQNAIESKRSLSPLSSERRAKKRKLHETSKGKKSKRVTAPSSSQLEKLHMAFVKAVVHHNLPLSITKRAGRYQVPFMEFMELASPGYHPVMPNNKTLRDVHLSNLFDSTWNQMVKNINRALSGVHAFGTIMFDGWEDVLGGAVVNVMIRVTSAISSQNATYLLDSVYSKERKVSAEEYVRVIKLVVEKLNPKLSNPFLGICGVVSDSASSCVKAKRILGQSFTGMVPIQDQAHAADLLLSDLGHLPWVQSLLERIITVVQTVKNKRKLNSRFKDLILQHDTKVKKLEIQDSWDDAEESEDIDNSEGAQASLPKYSDQIGIEPVQPTAVTLKTPAKTRFASSETTLESFVRSRDVLKKLVSEPLFTELYDGTSVSKREKRSAFVESANNEMLYKSAVEVHEVFRLIRRYLRIWDAEGCQVSEVAPATILLEHDLNSIDSSKRCYVVEERKNDNLQALEKRCKGKCGKMQVKIIQDVHYAAWVLRGKMQVKIIQDVHYAAWVLDPVLSPASLANYIPAFKRHLAVYLKGCREELVGAQLNSKVQEITEVFTDIHGYWEHLRRDPDNEVVLDSYAGTPMKWWDNEKVIPNDELLAFAKSTLGLCPSSCATERSFSHQGRIHSKQRNRLKPDVVRKLLFCKWNGLQLNKAKRTEWSTYSRELSNATMNSVKSLQTVSSFKKGMLTEKKADREIWVGFRRK